MAKRSPIAGYNHNVRYRGLIFHVQTEDSGLQSPHLFTHLFFGGVIISTRKLVYDAGSSEDAIKGLMQSQHKLVLKDLKRGTFDDKIDLYLAGTEGLLPRGATDDGGGERPTGASAPIESSREVPRASEPALQVRMSEPEITFGRPGTDTDLAPDDMLELDETPAPVISRAATPPPVPLRGDRKAPGKGKLPPPPAPEDLDPPTVTDSKETIAAAIAAANTTRTASILDSGPEIRLELDEDSHGRRLGRDTAVELPTVSYSDGVPGRIGASSTGRTAGDSIPPLPAPPERRTGDRMSAVGAAALPPARPIARPPSRQAITPPAVVSRPLTQDEAPTGDSDGIEVYAAAPASAELPSGERPGQYAQHKKISQKIPVEVIRGERGTGSHPIPAGLARPGRPSQQPANVPGSGGTPQRTREGSASHPTPVRAGPLETRPTERPRTPTPARVSASGPTPSRVPSSSSGVVMTRPAVIVGAPAKTAAAPRVRKAREEEGRGFGQGLISEKSLDEVILAYLSEDADEK